MATQQLHVSDAQRKLAAILHRQLEAIERRHFHKHSQPNDKFINAREDVVNFLTQNNWTLLGSGAAKEAYTNGDLVVKVIYSNSVSIDVLEWKDTIRRARLIGLEQHIVPTLGESFTITIQPLISLVGLIHCTDYHVCSRVASRLGIVDWSANHGHYNDGAPLFFDGGS